MVAYERYVTVEQPGKIEITGLPVRPGQKVRVTVTVDAAERAALVRELDELLKRTQALPQARGITDEEIAAEIEAHRRASAA